MYVKLMADNMCLCRKHNKPILLEGLRILNLS
jgi:hypothetical protein